MARAFDPEKAPDEKERLRTERMYLFERKYADLGFLIGVDEAGRGPLAGPVCAGAAVLPADRTFFYLNDSKKLTEKKREALYGFLQREALACATAFVEPARIDEINILEATYEAMEQAVLSVIARLAEKGIPETRTGALLIDAVHVKQLERFKQVSIVKGDAQSASIAAASVLAKVTRDRLMEEYDRQYPQYGFAKHKGYGTAAHIAAIREYGPCPIHRKTFITKFTGG